MAMRTSRLIAAFCSLVLATTLLLALQETTGFLTSLQRTDLFASRAWTGLLSKRTDGQQQIPSTINGPTISDDQYQTLVKRGRELDQNMRTTGEHVALNTDLIAQWKEYSALEQHKWKVEFLKNDPKSHDVLDSLKDAYAFLKVERGTETPPNVHVLARHGLGEALVTDESELGSSGCGEKEACLKLFLNTKAGVIVIDAADSPDSKARDYRVTEDNLPELKHMSDVLYLIWQEQAGKTDVAHIKHFLITSVVAQDVLAAIKRAFDKEHRATIPRFAGRASYIVNQNSESGLAILGCPLLAGIARFLAQHKGELGDKYISEISVWETFASEHDRHYLLDSGDMDSTVQTFVDLMISIEQV